MGCVSTKAGENIYFRCRKEAARYNDKLSSREGASELLGISPSSLADYELGITKVVPVDKAVLMADLYNAPEIKTSYCCTECPIGRDQPIATEISSIERATLKLLKGFSPDKLDEVKRQLIEIATDGVITSEEKPQLKTILDYLEYLIKAAGELRLIGQKCLNGRDDE